MFYVNMFTHQTNLKCYLTLENIFQLNLPGKSHR